MRNIESGIRKTTRSVLQSWAAFVDALPLMGERLEARLREEARYDQLVKTHGVARVRFAQELAMQTRFSTEQVLAMPDEQIRELARHLSKPFAVK